MVFRPWDPGGDVVKDNHRPTDVVEDAVALRQFDAKRPLGFGNMMWSGGVYVRLNNSIHRTGSPNFERVHRCILPARRGYATRALLRNLCKIERPVSSLPVLWSQQHGENSLKTRRQLRDSLCCAHW